VVFNTGPYTVLPDNSILITANMQSETGFPSSHQLKSYVASKSRLKLAARAVLSADAGLLVKFLGSNHISGMGEGKPNLLRKLMLSSTNVCMTDYSRSGRVHCHVTFKFGEITDNVLETVQHRDKVTVEDY